MLPFVPYNPNQQLPNCHAPQQQNNGNTSNMMPNFMQPGFMNPQSSMPFGNPNFNGSNGNSANQSGFIGVPNQAPQNGYMGHSHSGSAPIPQPLHSNQGFGQQNFNAINMTPMNGAFGSVGKNLNNFNSIRPPGQQLFGYNALNIPNQPVGFQNGQLCWQNTVQNMNQLVSNMSPAQVAALNQILGSGPSGGPVAQAMIPQNGSFLANQHLGMLQHLVSSAVDVNGPNHLPLPVQQSQGNLLPSSASSSPVPQQNQAKSFQGHHGKDNRMHSFTANRQHRNFKKDLKKNPTQSRFQSAQNHKICNLKEKHTLNNQNGEGSGNEKVKSTDNSAQQSKGGKGRSLAMFYTEEEIQQWRNERRKHYPTKVNVDKKISERTDSEVAASDAKLRRQQLKDILAKQAELGFEVPEIPSQYLSDPEVQVHPRHGKKRPFDKRDRFQNRNGKRGKFIHNERFTNKRVPTDSGSFKNHNRFSKKQNAEDNDSLKAPVSKRKPTLLQKLLDPDIKREKRHLLHAFRFMVINSFFKEWPAKPLKYPEVIVNAIEAVGDVVEEKSTSLKHASSESGNKTEEVDGDDAKATGEQNEEGEIID